MFISAGAATGVNTGFDVASESVRLVAACASKFIVSISEDSFYIHESFFLVPDIMHH
ncbi:hypothetical protein SDC9_145007 [bioreactor metagenome]|uniref:Uncharacterized protein n=1 Tax=bioreactor metagenome TaxID=1076179 RepID=A0A645E7K8_9ZZZZ